MLIHTPRELGHLVRDQRKQAGLSQRKLAEFVGVSRQWVIALEQGNAGAEVGLVLKALAAVELRIDVGARSSTPSADRSADDDAAAQVIVDARGGQAPRRLRISGKSRP